MELTDEEIKYLDDKDPSRRRFYIYETHLLISDRYYVGQRYAWFDDPELDNNYYGSGEILRPYLNKYGTGPDSVSKRVICQAINNHDLDELERKYIKICRLEHGSILDGGKCINIDDGGHGASEYQMNSNRNNHGGVLAWNTDDSMDKSFATRTEKYGDPAGNMRTDEVNLKRRATVIDKYGESYSHINNEISLAKRLSTNTEKYGSPCGQMHTKEATEKSRATAARHYNGDPYGMLHTPEVRAKSHKKMLENRANSKHKLVGPNGEVHITPYYKSWLKKYPNWMDLGLINNLTSDQSDDQSTSTTTA